MTMQTTGVTATETAIPKQRGAKATGHVALPRGERLERVAEAVVCEDRRVQAAGDLPQLLQAGVELSRRLVEQRRGRVTAVVDQQHVFGQRLGLRAERVEVVDEDRLEVVLRDAHRRGGADARRLGTGRVADALAGAVGDLGEGPAAPHEPLDVDGVGDGEVRLRAGADRG